MSAPLNPADFPNPVLERERATRQRYEAALREILAEALPTTPAFAAPSHEIAFNKTMTLWRIRDVAREALAAAQEGTA